MFLVFVVIFIWAMPFRPGLLRARLRSVAFGELNPTYPYRIFLFCCFFWLIILVFWWNYFLGDAFGIVEAISFCCVFLIDTFSWWNYFWAMSLEKKIIFSMFWAMPSENKDNAFIQKNKHIKNQALNNQN